VITALQMKQLRTELTEAGVFRHHELAGWGKVALLLAGIAACLVGTILGPLWLACVLLPFASLFATTAAMFGHEGSHRSFSASPRRNALLNFITFPLLTGLGATFWRNKHDVGHHGHPNVHEKDPDIKLWPMTSCRQAHLETRGVRRWFQRHCQGFMFWPLTFLLPEVLRFRSILYLIDQAKRGRVDGDWIADVACITAHYVGWLVIPSFIWGFWPVFLVYTLLWKGVGIMLALIFAPAHMGLPVILDQNSDWQHQLETTRNLKLPRVLRFFFVGLDYQVEHHLFPKIPHQELPKAEAITKAWCARVGVAHLEIGYGDAVIEVTRFMRDAWKTPALTGAEARGEPSRAAA
jgi:fatty acid desaturase